jgi:glycerophosphoryl diester phosphodiesterase
MRGRRAAGIAIVVAALACGGAVLAWEGSVLDRGRSAGPPKSPAERRSDGLPRQFDVQAHRGGLGLVTESTLEAFANALEIGVTALELDVRLSADDRPIVTHDRRVSAMKCRDTAPVVAGDPDFPYVGDPIRRLSLAQIATLDCGLRRLPGFPHQRVVANARMPLLGEVFALVDCYGADDVRFSIDPKFPAEAPGESASRGRLVHVVAREIRKAGMVDRVAIASVDWGVLMRMRKLHPDLPITTAAHPRFLQAGKLGGCDLARRWNAGRWRDRRRRVRTFHHTEARETRTPSRPEGDPVDRRRPGVDARSHQDRRGRPRHRLPRPTPDRHGPDGHQIAGPDGFARRRPTLPALSGRLRRRGQAKPYGWPI